jgi:hypothetical protein
VLVCSCWAFRATRPRPGCVSVRSPRRIYAAKWPFEQLHLRMHAQLNCWMLPCQRAPISLPQGALPKTNGACTVCARKQPGCLLSPASSIPSPDRERSAPPQLAPWSRPGLCQTSLAVFERVPGIFSKGHRVLRAHLPLRHHYLFFFQKYGRRASTTTTEAKGRLGPSSSEVTKTGNL